MRRMIVINGHLDLDPEDADKFVEIVVPLQRASLQEPGCIGYHFSRDLEVPGRFRVAECWESDEHLKVHFTTPDMATFQAGMKQLRRTGGEFWKYNATDRGPLR
jgi:quinol monooxygenase YgiN